MRIQSFGQPDHHFPSYAPGMRHAPGPEWEPASPWCWLLPWQRQPGGEWKKDQVMCIDVCCIWYTLGDAILYIYIHTYTYNSITSICIFKYIYIYHINWHIYEALASWDVPPRYERRDPDLIKKGRPGLEVFSWVSRPAEPFNSMVSVRVAHFVQPDWNRKWMKMVM